MVLDEFILANKSFIDIVYEVPLCYNQKRFYVLSKYPSMLQNIEILSKMDWDYEIQLLPNNERISEVLRNIGADAYARR